MAIVTWQGTDAEYARLYDAVVRNCGCVAKQSPHMCAAHLMLEDQNVLDRLLWVFRTRGAFIAREFYARPVSTR
jgi:hypothetical protein